MMNPFAIGQTLSVQFGNCQPFTVAALRADACLMRFPHTTTMSKWYSVADLLRWNPQSAPKPVLALPVPRIETYAEYQRVGIRQLAIGDVVHLGGSYSGDYLICEIRPLHNRKVLPFAPDHVQEATRRAWLQRLDTGERIRYPFRDATAEGRVRVVGRAS